MRNQPAESGRFRRRRKIIRRISWLPLILVALLSSAFSGEAAGLPRPPGDFDRLIRGLAAAIDSSLTTTEARVATSGDEIVVLSWPGSPGLRLWTLVTLVDSTGRAWSGRVTEISADRASLKSERSDTPPRVGSRVRVRELGQRAAMTVPEGDSVSDVAARSFFEALQAALSERSIRAGESADFASPEEARAEALESGASILIRPRLRPRGSHVDVQVPVTELKTGVERPPVTFRFPLDPPARKWWTSGGASGREAPPGCHFRSEEARGGFLDDFFPVRYRPGGVNAIFTDRIETLNPGSGALSPVHEFPLLGTWPVAVPTRWPVMEILPVNTYYTPDRQESKVFYSLCSNQRPRYLTVLMDREQPDSLSFVTGEGPRDTLESSFKSCFSRVDRVERPERYQVPADLPATAVTRLALSMVEIGPSGTPVPDEFGRLKTRRQAIVYYDEPTARLWIAAADTAFPVPGRFGGEMEFYRAGLLGPPGLLVTSPRPPGAGDHLEYWVLENGRLEKKWTSGRFDGAITAIHAGDLDGDQRDDVLFAELEREGPGFTTRLHLMTSRTNVPEFP